MDNETITPEKVYDPAATIVLYAPANSTPTEYTASDLNNHLSDAYNYKRTCVNLIAARDNNAEQLRETLIQMLKDGTIEQDDAQTIADIYNVRLTRRVELVVDVQFVIDADIPWSMSKSDLVSGLVFRADYEDYTFDVDIEDVTSDVSSSRMD